jgi:hypothetical protein
MSMQSYDDLGDEENWDPDRLLELSDLVRKSLKSSVTLCGEHVEVLLVVLRAMARNEQAPDNTANMIDVKIVQDSHFDKLLRDIRNAPETVLESPIMEEIQHAAHILEKNWIKRFRSAYMNLDHARGEEMLKFGELRDVTFNPNNIRDMPWIIKNARTIADQEGGLDFTPGQ